MRVVCALFAVLVAASALSVAAAAPSSVSGRILFTRDGDLWVLDTAGPHAMATGGTFAQPTWGPDSSSLAYVYRGTNFADIFVSDPSGDSQTRLTRSQSTVLDNNDWNLRPAWSPDGAQIAFASDRSSAFPTLWVMNAIDGSDRRLVNPPGLPLEGVDTISWAPDGSQIACTVYNEPDPTQIAIVPMRAAGRQAGRVLTTLARGAFDPAWSPDGQWIAFAGRDGYASEIYVVRIDGSGLIRLTSDGLLPRSPAWSPDGQHLAFLSNASGYYEIVLIDVAADANGSLAASNQHQITQDLHIDAGSGLSWGA